MTAPRWTEYVPLEQVVPAQRNAQLHDLEGMIRSIVEHGYNDAGIVDERTGRLVAGHGRVEALVVIRQRGLPTPDGLQVADDGGWLVPLQRGWSSKDDADAEAFIIRHNDLVKRGGVHAPTLLAMLDDIHSTDALLFEGLGYDETAMEDLFGKVNLDLSDYTGNPDDPGRAEAAPARGQDEDTDLDEFEDKPLSPATPTIICPACAHRFEGKV